MFWVPIVYQKHMDKRKTKPSTGDDEMSVDYLEENKHEYPREDCRLLSFMALQYRRFRIRIHVSKNIQSTTDNVHPVGTSWVVYLIGEYTVLGSKFRYFIIVGANFSVYNIGGIR
jgi:hypothetical protein